MTRAFPDFRNALKEKLTAGEAALGMFFLSGSSGLAEACGTTALDWIVFDYEAGTMSKEALLHLMQSTRGSRISPMIRVSQNNRHEIEHALDLGADGIIVPKIDTAEQARIVVSSALFPPHGNRGLNPVRASGYFQDVPGYIRSSNSKTLVLVQIESAESVRNIDEIVAVEGIDGIFIGCGDLALSLGVPGQMDSTAMKDAIGTVLRATAKAGKIPGIFAYSVANAREFLDIGFRVVAIGNDYKLLMQGINDAIKAIEA